MTIMTLINIFIFLTGIYEPSARLLLAELFMDVISDELARCSVEKSGHQVNSKAYHSAKQDIIRRYGSEIHLSFLNT